MVSSAAALHAIDPPMINKIILLGRRVVGKLFWELDCLQALWRIRVVTVPGPT